MTAISTFPPVCRFIYLFIFPQSLFCFVLQSFPIYTESKAARGGKSWELDRNILTEMHELGEGNFGKVFRALAVGLVPGVAATPVAVKTLTVRFCGYFRPNFRQH